MANGTVTPPEELGRRFGNEIFDLTRRRFASQFQGTRRGLRRSLAGRGLRGTAGSLADEALREEELRALAEASLQSQLSGRELGFREAERREGIRRFDIGQEFAERELAFRGEQAEAQRALQRELAELERGLQLRLLEEQRRSGRLGFLGDIFGAVGGAVGGGLFDLLRGGGSSPGRLPFRFL